MASEDSNPGCLALEECEQQVVITIKNHLDEIPRFLRSEKIISRLIYDEVTNVQSSEYGRAKKVYLKLRDKIFEDDKNWHVFVDYLSEETKSERTVAKLNAAYEKAKNKGMCFPSVCMHERVIVVCLSVCLSVCIRFHKWMRTNL